MSARRQGVRVYYRLASQAVSKLWRALRAFGETERRQIDRVVGSVILLDLTIYLQHLMFHALPAVWQLRMVHHADLDFDVTTGTRFHPIEILISMGIKLVVVTLLGAPARSAWWDRLLGTYIPEPAAGQDAMTLGVGHIREPRQTLSWMLALPFRAESRGYPFGRCRRSRSRQERPPRYQPVAAPAGGVVPPIM